MSMLKLPDRARGILPLVGAGLLLGLALALIHFAATTGASGMRSKLSAADFRHECASITDNAFRAECLRQADKAAHTQSTLDAIRNLPAVQ
jgi:hypothetical protein